MKEKVLLQAEQRTANKKKKTYLKTAFVKGPTHISKVKCQMKRSLSNMRKLIWSRHMNCISWISASGKGLNLLNQFRLIQCLFPRPLWAKRTFCKMSFRLETRRIVRPQVKTITLSNKRFGALIMSYEDFFIEPSRIVKFYLYMG